MVVNVKLITRALLCEVFHQGQSEVSRGIVKCGGG